MEKSGIVQGSTDNGNDMGLLSWENEQKIQ